MFPPIEEDEDGCMPVDDDDVGDGGGGGFDLASALGIDLPDGITAEDFQAFLWQSHILNTGRQKLQNINRIEQVIELINKSSSILVLTGAGISVSAGIPDFRSENGLYSQLKEKFNLSDPTTMFDIKYFLCDPSLFYSFGGDICPGFDDKQCKYYPTPTHYFIKLLEKKGKLLRNYTQNIDTLEYRAGIKNIITCHGSYMTASCCNCQFQINGIHIQKHIFNKKIPFCPYCCPNKSNLKHLIKIYQNNKKNKLRKHCKIITMNKCRNIIQFKLPKILCSMQYLQKGCPVIFSFDDNKLQKAIFDTDQLKEEENDDDDNDDDINMNFKCLLLKCDDEEILNICHDAVIQWLKTEINSYGVIKPDIVFFSEALSVNYHNTLEQDIKKCDLLLIMGTSLQVEPVSSIPKKIPSDIPAILINRECVGYPNQFDVNLLGNCDDVCMTLINKLKWKFIAPKKNHIEMKKEEEQQQKEEQEEEEEEEYNIKAIETMEVEAKLSEYEFVEPNYYLFPNGVLPDNVYRPKETRKVSDVDMIVDEVQ